MRRSVVLPQPDGPRSVRNSPCRIVRSIRSTAVKSPKRLVTFLSSTIWSMWRSDATEPIQSLRNKIDIDLFCLKVGIKAEGTELAADAALLVAAPRCFVESGVIGIQPCNAGAQAAEHAQ